MTVSELIEYLSMLNPDAEVLLTDAGGYNIKRFLRIKDTMVWSGGPILCIGEK